MRLLFHICISLVLLTLSSNHVSAQELVLSHPHGFCENPFTLSIGWSDSTSLNTAVTIRYTLDGSEPSTNSSVYQRPLQISGNTILRVAAVADTGRVTPVKTATYLFVNDILQQSNTPQGYPQNWGNYTTISGTAIADYEMDPEMTNNPALRQHIIEGLKSLPVLSIVTDKDHLFSHENDSLRGGIYIFTGPPVGDATGHGWTRPASIELIGGPQNHDLSVNCGLRLHGGHGRLAEKNPKHSFRLVFKPKYDGPKTLKYPLFGEGEPAKFDQLIVRCHFGNTWQHWGEGNRQNAQYTRDVWARRMQKKMGHTSVNALYVHLFLNGMYWGLYNIAERVDDQYGKDHLGGSKDDIDVVKIEEDNGNHIEAAEGDLEAWNRMVETASKAADDTYYYLLQGKDPDGEDDPELEALLDIDAFIDYMLINQYAANTDWDHHNWYAIRRRGTDSQGFRFLCWDSEIIFESVYENVLSKNNGKKSPTGIFQNLLRNEQFAKRYLRRAKAVLAGDGMLGEESVVAVWDSLYHTISSAIYDEAARWGDYRRDVHQWQSRGQLYTVDNHYQAERNRLLTQYFPYRSENVLNDISSYVSIDDFEAPGEWVKLTASMFHEWDGTGADAQPLDKDVYVDWNFGMNVGGGGAIAGFVNVDHNQFADLSQYESLVLRGKGNDLRILANRLVAHGPYKQAIVSFNNNDPYWNNEYNAIVFPLEDLKNAPTNEGRTRNDSFFHLNVLKVNWNSTVNVSAAYLIPSADASRIDHCMAAPIDNKYYNLNGQQVDRPSRGIYIKNGKKLVVR